MLRLHPKTVVPALLLALGVAVAAAELPRLPKPIAIPKGDDSPGQVTFDHASASHLDAKKPSCTACHPRLFPMLHESGLAKGVITHEKMEKGQYCGACHGKGKAAFGFEDDYCMTCHSE